MRMRKRTRLISRDPFARWELHKRLHPSNDSCRWCEAIGRVYQFEIHHDDKNKPDVVRGLFCSVSCMRDYHN